MEHCCNHSDFVMVWMIEDLAFSNEQHTRFMCILYFSVRMPDLLQKPQTDPGGEAFRI